MNSVADFEMRKLGNQEIMCKYSRTTVA